MRVAVRYVHVDGEAGAAIPGAGNVVAQVFGLRQCANVARRGGPGVIGLIAEGDLRVAGDADVGILADIIAVGAVGAVPIALRRGVVLDEAGSGRGTAFR